MIIRTYSELIKIPTFEERLHYLNLDGKVSETTFGSERYLNQKFYTSEEWRKLRRYVVLRDNGYDLGLVGYEIIGKIIVHHMNPISEDDILHHSEYLVNPDYLISTSLYTHNMIHYGDVKQSINKNIERTPNDTCPWRK